LADRTVEVFAFNALKTIKIALVASQCLSEKN